MYNISRCCNILLTSILTGCDTPLDVSVVSLTGGAKMPSNLTSEGRDRGRVSGDAEQARKAVAENWDLLADLFRMRANGASLRDCGTNLNVRGVKTRQGVVQVYSARRWYDQTRGFRTVLDQIDLGSMALPEFQRGYVWNRDQVRGLMQSLYRKHPVGSLLVWETRTESARARDDGRAAGGIGPGRGGSPHRAVAIEPSGTGPSEFVHVRPHGPDQHHLYGGFYPDDDLRGGPSGSGSGRRRGASHSSTSTTTVMARRSATPGRCERC
jgi:hypothetical protein